VCGLAGIARHEPRGVPDEVLRRMAAALRHRGPDGYGIYAGRRVGLAHTRLSIIDLVSGAQPLTNEDGRIVIVYNGEVYNYIELRRELEPLGHRFRTQSDTEVLVHAYEQWGERMLERLNGQFALAIYDRRDESLFLARDRFGVRPLFYALHGGDLLFGSEVKAILAAGEIAAAPDPAGLDEVFTFWAARAPRTPFRGVHQLEPGACARWRDGRLTTARWYALHYESVAAEPADALATLDTLMRDSVRLRMRADVPVGGYLSGGLDSSITCALAAAASPHDLRTFSVSFDDPALDESDFQREVAAGVKSRHAVQQIGRREIAAVFPDVVRHAETPLVRTAPAPMFLLSRLTRDQGVKVVLTGEGSDELFLGYDIFKETAVRLFCLRQPASTARPKLLDRLYPYLAQGTGGAARGGEFWRKFFLAAAAPGDPLFSHLPRFALTARIREFYSDDVKREAGRRDVVDELRQSVPSGFMGWRPEHRAAWLEMDTLLASYLLSSQGDRMGLAHGIEGRFPFLDHRLYEFTSRLPVGSKLRGMHEKVILRRWARGIVPPRVLARHKQPYRAPDIPAFMDAGRPGYVDEMLGEPALRASGLFDPAAVGGLLRRCRDGRATGFAENQAFVAILSTQLWHDAFIRDFTPPAPLPADRADVRLDDSAAAPPSLEPLLH
jgi:asparagine synthase (glutamine-hydrolysing)